MRPAFTAEINRQGTLVHARYSGRVTAADMVLAVATVGMLLRLVRPGFSVLTDLSDLETMELECGPYYGKIMDMCRERGLSKVVRVIPDRAKDIGLNILSIIHYGPKVRVVTCRTLAEAEAILG